MTQPNDLLQRITALKETAARVQKMRNDAELADRVATTQLAQIDEELTRLGVNPEKAEEEVAALETALQLEITRIGDALAAEEQALTVKLTAARQAGLIR